MASRRLARELGDIRKSEDLKLLGITAEPNDESNLLNWTASIKGPAPYYAGGTFKLNVTFSNECAALALSCLLARLTFRWE